MGRSLVLLLLRVWAQDDERNFDDYDLNEALTADQLRQIHAKFDGDSDGHVSLQELLSYAVATGAAIARRDATDMLQDLDKNKDGAFGIEEYMHDLDGQADGGDQDEINRIQAQKEVEVLKFRAADADGDGKLQVNELAGLFFPETNRRVLAIHAAHHFRMKDVDQDGNMSLLELWDSSDIDEQDFEISDEERGDFALLDKNGDGSLSVEEFASWESGWYHVEQSLLVMMRIADADADARISADELAGAQESLVSSDAMYHLLEWAEHHEL